MYYSTEDVKHLLDSLRNSYETEVVEYKEAKSSFGDKELGKYLSALSNEALLEGKADAWLFFGIVGDFEGVCGTSYRAGNPKGLQNLKRDIAEQATKLHEMGLVEGRWPHLTIASDIAVRTDGRAEYVRSKGLNDEACRQLILQMLRDTGPAKRGEILAMLADLLPVGLTKAQKARKVSNLLADMKRDGAIVNERVGKGATWRIA